MIGAELSRRADTLRAERRAFVVATVVRVAHPASARPGDTALVLGDGAIEGFVGGACAEESVRLHALQALQTGEPVLLKIVPDAAEPAPEGSVAVRNPCRSAGALEIFLEPAPVSPRMVVVGGGPIAAAVTRLGRDLGLDVVEEGTPEAGDLALVVAAHGGDEARPVAAALVAGVPYVGLVASRRRGAAVLDELRAAGVPDERAAALDTPAGLDIGARTPQEIAVSILARVVEVRRRSPGTAPSPAVAIDPICGMTVAAVDATPHIDLERGRVYFCGEGCRAAFERDPAHLACAR